MKLKILSGGQTGADEGALRAAKAAGLETGGWIGWDFLTENGPRPEYAELYGLREVDLPRPLVPTQVATAGYRLRTYLNVLDCDAVLWFGNPLSRGGKLTINEATRLGKPVWVIEDQEPTQVVYWLEGWGHYWQGRREAPGPLVVMVAGNRESLAPGIAAHVETFLGEVFRLLANERT